MSKLTEYKTESRTKPKWIDSIPKEDHHTWYLRAKRILLTLKAYTDTTRLEASLKAYEEKHIKP